MPTKRKAAAEESPSSEHRTSSRKTRRADLAGAPALRVSPRTCSKKGKMPEESRNVMCNGNGDVKDEAESLRSKPAVSSKQGKRGDLSGDSVSNVGTPEDGKFPAKESVSSERVSSLKKGKKQESGNVVCNGDGEAKVKAQISYVNGSLSKRKMKKEEVEEGDCRLVGEVIPDEEARQRWPERYEPKKRNTQASGSKSSKDKDDSEEIVKARCHYRQAEIDGRVIVNLNDDAHVKAGDNADHYICKIVELFVALDGTPYFTAQWFYRARDTVIKDHANLIDNKRVFFSEMRDDNPLDCLVQKLNIARVPHNLDLEARKLAISSCDYYYDMLYLLDYSSFIKLPPENSRVNSETLSTISSEANMDGSTCELKSDSEEVSQARERSLSEMTLLDLYSGCGAMSTGLCLGAKMSGVNLVTRWAIDINAYACESVRLNHPETQVRNESAEDFLALLREWEKLCVRFSLIGNEDPNAHDLDPIDAKSDEENDDDDNDNSEDEDDFEVFEVQKIIGICYGDPKDKGDRELHFKVRWKGYGPSADSWEPFEGLGNCCESIKDFVTEGYKSKILPLPGDVDVICGGPPCQGISGFNRFRNKENPLEDPKNKQLVVFMDVVNYLKPRFVLMENVVDIVKFAGGYLGRYALGRLIGMNYQTRMGMMAAGAYGLPQFRMRVFMWGARFEEVLPQYPLPTHDVIIRGVIPLEFEMNTVAYDEGHKFDELETKLLLADAISDLPPVTNDEARDEMPYGKAPQSEFQRFIRLRKNEMLGTSPSGSNPSGHKLYDHRPLELNADDYQRVCQIPKTKGANFRDLPGVLVGADNKVEWDPNVERVYLPSGKPLVPDYAMSFVGGSSSKPFGRLWWDETVPTVVTRAEPHNQVILHPEQDRVLSIRENARLQGFPDYYQLRGPVKERYIQVGNAVAVPVARALGYALGLAAQGSVSDGPMFILPPKFPNMERNSSLSTEEDA
uniref:DNA (cytosine-5-)-methyltransferase n=1 Tax=Vitis davidii TaxID=103354 RepID=A0AAU7N4H5_9ROSI